MSQPNTDWDVPSAEVIDRYLVGESTAGEAEQVLRWVERHSDGHVGVDLLRQVRMSSIPKTWEAETHWNDFFRRLVAQQSPPVTASLIDGRAGRKGISAALANRCRTSGTNARKIWYSLAAFTLAVLCLIVGWQSGEARVNRGMSVQASIYTTGRGERAIVTLPDGSTAVLNVDSKLEVPANYASGNRALRLVGEAMFSVRQQTQHPFTVTAGTGTVRVLGTSFVVRHYEDDSATSVAVRDGKVALRSTVVSANQYAVLASNQVSVASANSGQFTFASGILTLNDMTLSDAVIELNRWYNADIRLGDPTIAQQRIGGRFGAGSLDDMAASLEWTFGLRVIREGRTLTLYPGN